MKNITQTLAGRTAIVNLLPFSLTELLEQPAINIFDLTDLTDIGYIENIYGKSGKSKYGKPPLRLEEYLFKGFYPPIYDKQKE